MRDQCLKNKTAVITGASSGIGRAIALLLAAHGARVVVNYCHSENKASQVVEAIQLAGGEALSCQADVGDTEAIEQLIQTAQEAYGNIDIWVNNAGADILTGSAATDNIQQKLQRLIETDLQGTIEASWAIAPVMQQQGYGVIINNAWDLATHGFAGRNPQIFAATKAGILGFSRSLALTIAPAVRVNIIAPGWIHTEFAEQDMADDYYQARVAEIPLGRFGRPEDVANAALYLASDDAAYLTGEVININGGLI